MDAFHDNPITWWGLALLLGGWIGSELSDLTSDVDPSVAKKMAPIHGLAAEAGLPNAWGDFFALVAWRESKGNPQAINDSPGEAAAAARAFDRNRHRYEGCDYAVASYTFGSGGWFGMLPANALAQLGDEHRCLPPSSVFDPRVAMAMAVGFARGLMKWDGYQKVPTWLNLRAMWGWPAKGGNAQYLANARLEFAEDAAAVGLPPLWLDGRPPPLPMTAAEVLALLKAT